MRNQPFSRSRWFAVTAVFAAMALIVLGDALFVTHLPAAAVPSFSFFHELIDLLALIVTLYAAHRWSSAVGLGGMAWFICLHVLGMAVDSSLQPIDLVRQSALMVVAILGVRIIAIHKRQEEELKRFANEVEIQRLAAIKLADELLILNGIANIGVEAADVDALVRDAIQVIDSAFHPDYFDILLLDETHGATYVYRLGETGPTPSVKQGVTGQVLDSGRMRRIPDVSREPAYVMQNPDVRSELCVPLKIAQRVVGVINVESRRLDAFTKEDEHLMMTFADQLVTAVEKVRLFQLEQRRTREAETLREAGAVVAATLSQEETIKRILAQLKRVIPYDSASVQLLCDGYMEIVGGQGWPDAVDVVGMRFPIPGDNPNTIVVQERRPYVLNDAPAAYGEFHEGPHSHIRSFLGVPLIVGDQVIGMLAVDSMDPNFFNADHVRLTTAFADQVAVAIQNARLFREVEQLAHTDGLTGLNNRHRFLELARHEFKRARRHPHALSAIMLDIDHFKTVNDTYGHAVGDHVLQTVARRCKGAVREIDILGRYGGEEFVSILLETDLHGANMVAERLRRCVEEPPIETERGPLSVTVSIGIADMNADCQDLESLLRHADQALYAAKQAGRNQVAIWQP